MIAGGTDHGFIVAYARTGGLGPVTVQALERAATVAALAITKQLAVSAVESKFRGDFLRDALAGAAGPPAQVIEHCAQLGWDVDRPLCVVVAQLDDARRRPASRAAPPVAGRAPAGPLTAAWQQVVRSPRPGRPGGRVRHEVVALVRRPTRPR